MPEDDDNGNEGLSLFQDVTFDKVIYLLPLLEFFLYTPKKNEAYFTSFEL